MKRSRIISTLCVCALCLTATQFAAADYVGLVTVTKNDEDAPGTVDLCNNANGDFVPFPLSVCNILAQFDDPTDRLLSVGFADVSTSDPLGYFQHPFGANTPYNCALLPPFPDLICDSYVAIGFKCNDSGTDGTTTDPDFDVGEFNNNGHVGGGWFNSNSENGQGDAGQDPPNQNLQVMVMQLSVTPGEPITGTIDVFAKIGPDILAFPDQPVECLSDPQDCPPGEGCDDGNPCTVDDTCDEDENCVGTDMDCSGAGDQCNTASCDPNGADGNCDIITPEPDGTECDDDDACTDPDQCTAGSCGGSPVDCSGAGDQCNTASCDPNGADGNCDILTPLPPGTACGDPNDTDCDNPDTCNGAGACQDNFEPSGTPCPDDDNDCTDDLCDESGTCTHSNLPDGTGCDDGQACTDPDQCAAGSCGGTDVDCSGAGDQCNTASCDPNGADGNCDILTPLQDGTECDDGVLCTGDDTCSSGQCAGLPVDCSGVGGPCDIASCDPAGAQINCDIITPLKDGTSCDDGESCTANDACFGGQCSGNAADCNQNGIPDCVDIDENNSGDCNDNRIPDECEVPKSSGGLCTEGCAPDCDGNGVIDSCDIAQCLPGSQNFPACDDCNLNEVPDGCDVNDGDPDGNGHVSDDEDGDGVPDECIEPEPPEGGFNWSDNIWDLFGENPDFPYPDNSEGVADLSVTLSGEDLSIFVDVNVVIPSLRLINGAVLDVTQTGDPGDLTIVDTSGILDGNLLIEGTLTVGEGRVIDAAGRVTIGAGGIYKSVVGLKRPPAGDLQAGELVIECSGSADLQGTMQIETSGDIVLSGDDKGDCTPPDFDADEKTGATAGGDFVILGSADIDYSSSEPLHLGGDFDNRSTEAGIFDWRDGGILMNGPLHTFEAAGEDRGPWPIGLENNFAIGTLTLAADTNVQVVDTFDNQQDGTAACDEALYVDVLEVGPGATLITQGCRVYYNDLINDGFIPELGTNVLQILGPCLADLNGDGIVNAADLATLLGSWGPCPGCPADLDGDNVVDAFDLAILLGAWGACL